MKAYEVEHFRYKNGAIYNAKEFDVKQQNPPVEDWVVTNDGGAKMTALIEAGSTDDAVRAMMDRVASPESQAALTQAVLDRYGVGR